MFGAKIVKLFPQADSSSMPKEHEEIDAITLARAQRGESNALEVLVKIYSRPVYALVRRMMGGRSDLVDDTYQDALIRVIQSISRFDPTGEARLATWILTIATRACIDALRRHKRTELFDDELLHEHGPELLTQGMELEKRIKEFMAALPMEYRAVLILRAYHDFDYEEIAQTLGIGVGTVKSRLARARLELRQAMHHDESAS